MSLLNSLLLLQMADQTGRNSNNLNNLSNNINDLHKQLREEQDHKRRVNIAREFLANIHSWIEETNTADPVIRAAVAQGIMEELSRIEPSDFADLTDKLFRDRLVKELSRLIQKAPEAERQDVVFAMNFTVQEAGKLYRSVVYALLLESGIGEEGKKRARTAGNIKAATVFLSIGVCLLIIPLPWFRYGHPVLTIPLGLMGALIAAFVMTFFFDNVLDGCPPIRPRQIKWTQRHQQILKAFGLTEEQGRLLFTDTEMPKLDLTTCDFGEFRKVIVAQFESARRRYVATAEKYLRPNGLAIFEIPQLPSDGATARRPLALPSTPPIIS